MSKASNDGDMTRLIRIFKESQTLGKTPAGYDLLVSEYLVELGNRLKLIRKNKLHCSQFEMGEILNLSQSEVSRLERGQRKMNIFHLFTLKSLDPDLDLNTLIDIYNAIEFHDKRITTRRKNEVYSGQ